MTLQVLDYLGVFVFAITGALVAGRKDMDIFGFVVLALMPAIGGGTLRDLVLDVPVFWVADTAYLFLTLAAALVTFAAHKHVVKLSHPLRWLDAIGLSVFCVIGASKALAVTSSATVAVFMGVVTAVAGGIIRDVVANEVPLILQKEVYATAAFFGALTFVALHSLSLPLSEWAGIAVAMGIRSLGIAKGLSLPRAPHAVDRDEG